MASFVSSVARFPAPKGKNQDLLRLMIRFAHANNLAQRWRRKSSRFANPSRPRGQQFAVLRVPSQLRRTLANTSVIESAFSIVTVCRNVKRWRAGDHLERWVGSGLLVTEQTDTIGRYVQAPFE